MKSIMTKDFSRVAQTDIQRSTFDRTHGLKTAFDSGYLVPVELQEIVPSDTVEFDGRVLARLAPVVTPVMDNVVLDLHAFFVPSRIIWNNFTKMMGERKNPNDSIDYLVPSFTLTGSEKFGVGSLADYFGLPIQQVDLTSNLKASILPFRAYQKIYDDWYRDENLQDSVIQTTDELGDTIEDLDKWVKLRKRGKRHDYFTSGLPWPQKGEGVNLPLGGSAPVVGTSQGLGLTYVDSPSASVQYLCSLTGDRNAKLSTYISKTYFPNGLEKNSTDAVAYEQPVTRGALGVTSDANRSGLIADLSDATAATINSLRMAFQLQRMMESDARGGTRYVEIIRNHFKTICPDARLQRSEYLGGASIPIVFSPVAQTSGTTDVSPQGNLAATAHAYGNLRFTKSFSEHGYLIVIANVRADLNYQQGIDRLWTRSGRYDFYWPTLAHLGEQAIYNKEIFAQGNEEDDDVFAYQERYAEMRYNPSRITGKMRSGVDGSLDVWHLAQNFEDLPKLSAEFIEDNPPLDRVLAVTEGEPQIIADFYLGQKWTRPLPTYSIPGLIDHL